jgi:uncharacterized membrane protein YccC
MVFLTRAGAWAAARLAERRVQLRLALRMTVAAVLAYGLSQVLHLPWALWSVLTAVIVTQMSVGKSLIATIDYLIGTLGGSIYSGLVGMIMPHDTNLDIAIALALAIAPLSLLASSNSRFAAAPFTAVMVLLLPTITHASSAQSAFFRIVEVGVGCMTALAVSFLVLPQRAHGLLYEAVARILAQMADILPMLVADLRSRRADTPARRLQGEIGAKFRKLAVISAEAAREKSAYFNADPDPQPLIDLVLRLRHDLVMMGRAATEPLPLDIMAILAAPIDQFAAAARNFLSGSATALTGRTAPPPLAAIDAAFTTYSDAFTQIRRDGLLRDLSTDAAERVFILAFSCEQMRADFAALANLICKTTQTARMDESKNSDANREELA